MQNFSVNFIYPWLLLLLIPAVGLILFTHFFSPKRYRSNRNRIISCVLCMICMFLTILTLSGMNFSYELNNAENELMLVIDFSTTQTNAKVQDTGDDQYSAEYVVRDEFIENILTESKYQGIKVGMVAFGLNQVYLAPLSYNIDDMYSVYADAVQRTPRELDISATDIAAALTFAANQFKNPQNSKILLISDGIETDESTRNVIRNLVSAKITVDVTRFDEAHEDDGIQILGIKKPNYDLQADEEFTLSTEIYSEGSASAYLEIFDNGVRYDDLAQNIELNAGVNTFNFTIAFETSGLHELKIGISYAGSEEEHELNNVYYEYAYLEVHDKVLVLEQRSGDSQYLVEMLSSVYSENLKLINIKTQTDIVPKTVDELRAYDQVILNNISNADMGEDFVAILDEYVHEYGGGLLTLGGSNDDGTAHAYSRRDLLNTKFQEMLPVQAINYKPPVGVVFIIDVSGSMEGIVPLAKDAAKNCLGNDILTDRDYVGVMTMSDTYTTDLQLTSCVERNTILEAIDKVGGSGGTLFEPSVRRAIRALRAETNIDKRHIIMISDGALGDDQVALRMGSENPDISLSFIGVGDMFPNCEDMVRSITAAWRGETYRATNINEMMDTMRNDILAPAITEYTAKDFFPKVNDKLSPVVKGVAFDVLSGEMDVKLNGYYGVKARSSANVVLAGEYNVPIYAQWMYGKGNVGSLMCDLYGTYSADFINAESGQQLIKNIVAKLMPVGNIRPSSITLTLNGNSNENYNYYNSLSVYHDLESGETLRGKIIYSDDNGRETEVSLNEASQTGEGDCYVILGMDSSNNYSRANFIMKKGGAYRIVVDKLDSAGKVIDSAEIYSSFAFSTEYDIYGNKKAVADELIGELVERTGGKSVSALEGDLIFEGFSPQIKKKIDPTLIFMIIAMVCFLLIIAVRKFKFKWIHEIIRERKEKKERK